MNGEIFRDSDGKAISFAWPGGYPVVHVMNDGEVLCADCVNNPKNPVHEGGYRDGWRIEGSQIHYEGPDEICAHCGKVIPSAYGDPDASDGAE